MVRLALTILIVLGLCGLARADEPLNPIANAKAVVTVGHARFTVLTPAMIRMEWSAKDQFEDRASFAFVNRRLDVPEFTNSRDGDWTVIKTRELTLRYRADGGRFAKDNLSIELQCAGKPVKWVPGMSDIGNLRGTTRTLDGVSGACELESGLLSRDGWAVVDDSKRLLFDSAPSLPHADVTTVGMAPISKVVDVDQLWVATRNDPDAIDWYFFGYGHDYKRALLDFTRVGGRIPLPPRYVFGAWWSRYWAYSDAELRQLVKEFDEHDVPLDVLVVDMDWHLDGWTGYTWNPKYFPDPKGFLDWAHEKGLKVTLNLHPADGVGKHEAAFADFAKAMGLDPAKTERIPFDCTDQKYMDAYFKLLHHPLEKMGIDFWWLDWQQGTETKIAGLDPLFWLNHLHWQDMAHNPERTCATAVSAVQSTSKPTSASVMEEPVAGARGLDHVARLRPLIFSRWGGLGNHRYPIGFSGDTYNNWESLAFQPYFTATAGNVGYGYWSHDIGGHQPGKVDPELYVRWIQWGALSPILRTHTTKNPEAERRIWAFPQEYFLAAREAYRLRYQLQPYIYTMARKTYDTGLPLCRPLYYEWPELDEAYSRTGQYMFGDDLLVAPVTEPGDPMTGCANVEVWIPPGKWTNWFTGRTYEGPRIARLLVPLEDIPLFVRDGGVIPMQASSRRLSPKTAAIIALNTFPGRKGRADVYLDDGVSESYLNRDSCIVQVDSSDEGEKRTVLIGSLQGSYSRNYSLIQWVLKYWDKPYWVATTLNGEAISPESPIDNFEEFGDFFAYFGDGLGPNFTLPFLQTNRPNEVVLDNNGAAELIRMPSGSREITRAWMLKTPSPFRLPEGNRGAIDIQVAGAFWLGKPLDVAGKSGPFISYYVDKWFPVIADYAKSANFLPAVAVNWLGLYHKFETQITNEQPLTIQSALAIAPTMGLVDYKDIKGNIEFDAAAGVANHETSREFDGLSEDKPVVVKTAITNPGNVDTIRLTANVKLTKGDDSVAFPFSQTLFPSINHWWVVGPFEATFEKGLATEYPPESEKEFDAAAKYDGKGGEKIEWKRVSRAIKVGDDPTKEYFVDLNKLYDSPGNSVAFGLTYLTAPADMDATLAIGSDDGAAMWLNGVEIYRQDVGRAYTSKQDRVTVKLKKGANPLLIKVKQGGGGWGFCVHVENEKGEPLPEVKAVLER